MFDSFPVSWLVPLAVSLLLMAHIVVLFFATVGIAVTIFFLMEQKKLSSYLPGREKPEPEIKSIPFAIPVVEEDLVEVN